MAMASLLQRDTKIGARGRIPDHMRSAQSGVFVRCDAHSSPAWPVCLRPGSWSKPLVLLERQALPGRAAQGASRSHSCKEASYERRQQIGRSPSPMRLREFGSSKRRRSKPKIINLLPELDSPPASRKPRDCRTEQALSELNTPYNEHVAARQHPQCLRNCAGCEGGCASSRSGSTSLPRFLISAGYAGFRGAALRRYTCRETMATITMIAPTLKARAAN